MRALVLPNDSAASGIAAPAVELFYGRLEDSAIVAESVRNVDAVYHLAAALSSRDHTDDEYFEYNLRGTYNLLMAVRKHAPGLRRFAYASSDAVYHSGAAGACYLPVDEAHPRLAASIYGATKIGAEELCLTFWRSFGIPVTILRFGPTTDASELIDPNSVFARWLFLRRAIEWLDSRPAISSAEHETLGILRNLENGSEQLVIFSDSEGNPEIRNWGDARDVADGCARVLDVPAATGEVFNLGGVAAFSIAELVRHIAVKLNLPYVTARVPTSMSPWYISSAKARGMLCYVPRFTVFNMVEEAVGKVAGLRGKVHN